MNKYKEVEMVMALEKVIIDWLETGEDRPDDYIGDDVSFAMAQAAVSVLVGISSTQEYLKDNGYMKEDE